jgi:uncharacterized protein YbaA (DUF1428 family)
MPYVDGFVMAVPKDRIDDYVEVARTAGELWREHGALSVMECVADDETVFFSWIVYESREARDEVNKKVMTDPRMQGDMARMPFDAKRMIYGGFRPLVEL